MKSLTSVFLFAILLASLLPSETRAQDYSTCDEGTIECYCPPDVSVGDIGGNPLTDEDALDADNTCLRICTSAQALPDVFGTVTHYALQCKISGTLVPLASHALDEEPALETFYGDVLGEPLGVKIPGFDEAAIWTVTGDTVKTNALGEYVKAVYTWLIAAGAIVAVFMLMVAGVQYSLARGDSGRLDQAKGRIVGAVTGLVLLFAAYSIAFLINPDTVAFDSLTIKYVQPLGFINNETPPGSPATYPFALSSEPAEGGVGWNGVPMYNQNDFADVPYAPDCFSPTQSNIKTSGCGATSYAMAASYLTGQTIDPEIVAYNWSQNGSCPDAGSEYGSRCRACKLNQCGSCNGTFGFAFVNSNLQSQLGLHGESIGDLGHPLSTADKNEILELLGRGELIISSYTQPSGNGHYVVLVGLDADGNILVNNPLGGQMEVRDPEQYWTVAKSFYHVY